MIKIKVDYQPGKKIHLLVTGHAHSNEYGKDLVCAAVSAVITGGFSSIKEDKDYEFTLCEGKAELINKKEISNHDDVVIETIITSLRRIEDSNPKFIKFI